MRWVELGADGGGDDGVRREDAVQPTEDDRLHTLAATLVTLQRHLDRAMKAVEPAALQAASPSNRGCVAGRQVDRPRYMGDPSRQSQSRQVPTP